MKVKVSELTGAALDWAVARCEVGADFIAEIDDPHFYSTDWAQGGPIIEREGIDIQESPDRDCYMAFKPGNPASEGPTQLIAAMRYVVASKMGDTIDVPDELA